MAQLSSPQSEISSSRKAPARRFAAISGIAAEAEVCPAVREDAMAGERQPRAKGDKAARLEGEAGPARRDGRAAMPQPRGRGARSNASGRFEVYARVAEPEGWSEVEDLPPLQTHVTQERAKTIITRNDSPDISFDRSINPYRGCEHGCVYCFARPSHAYMGLSAGLDFESRLFVKLGAAELLERELSAQGYQPRTIAIGTNTDPYQPIERKYRVMRQVLEVLARTQHPVGIVTKSALVLRDLDLLAAMAEKGLVKVALSVTTLDPVLARRMEPRASTPEKRTRGDQSPGRGRRPDERHGCADHSRPHRWRTRDDLDPRSCHGRARSRIYHAASASRTARSLQRMAARTLSEQVPPCSLPHAVGARRQGL